MRSCAGPGDPALRRLPAPPSTATWTATTCSSTCGRARIGSPLTYPSVYDLVCRIRERTGIAFGPHTFRHTYATELLRRGVAVEVVAHLLGHASIATTSDAYAHLKIEDARRALVAAGWLADQDEPR